jgi:eukaryotic-like serine/threonine-protein kinase
VASAQQLSQLFEEAVALPREQRVIFLDRVCKDNAPLRAELERLLDADGPAQILSEPAMPRHSSSTESESPIVFVPGDKVADRYRIIRFVDEGGMGQVYQAHDEVLDTVVALKTIRPKIASDMRTFERFKREVRLAHEVADENVCRVFDLDHRNVPPFLTMEFLEGETLAAHLRAREKPMSVAEALPLVEQMARGLDAAHRKGVIHGDLKPGNVILTPTSDGSARAKITDFGLARTQTGDGSISFGHRVGTPSYMAPEQLAGGKGTVASDIYALGLVMYEIVTGTRPEFNRMTEPPPSPGLLVPELDTKWETAILRCLARDPAERFAAAGDVERAIYGEKPTFKTRRWILVTTCVSLCIVALLAFLLRGYIWWGPKIREGSWVLLSQVENFTRDPELDAVTDVLREQLGQSPRFNLVDGERVREMLQRMRRDSNQKLDPPTLREVAWRDGAPLVIFGTLSRLSQDYTLNLKIERVSNHPDAPAASWNNSWNAGSKKELFSALRDGSRWIRNMAGEAAREVSELDRPPEDVTTSSWRALQLMMQANKKNATGDHEAAVLLLKESLQFDPEFAMADMRLGDILLSLQRWEGYRYWQEALRLTRKHRLSQREEYRIRGQYCEDVGDFLAAVKAYRDFVSHYPNDFHGAFLLGSTLRALGRDVEALQEFSRAEKLRPFDFRAPAQLAMAYMDLGRADQAQVMIGRVRNAGQQDWATWLEAAAAFIGRRFEEGLTIVGRLSESPDEYWRSRSYALRASWLSDLGRYREALDRLQEGLAYDLPRGLKTAQADKKMMTAYLYFRRHESGACRDACLQAVSLDPSPDRYCQAGALLARSGHITQAQQVLALMPSKPDLPFLRRAHNRLKGEIALAQGDIQEAIRNFRNAAEFEWPVAPRECLARALNRAGETGEAMTLYKQIVDRPGRMWSARGLELPGLWADTLFQYASLARRSGSSEAADLASFYINLRKNADDGIEDVVEARDHWR